MWNSKKLRLAACLATSVAIGAPAHADPNCAGPNRWPANMTYAWFKNAGLLTPGQVDFARARSELIASQKIGRDLYRQVFKVAFQLKGGRTLAAITVSDASSHECSMSAVTVYHIADAPRRRAP